MAFCERTFDCRMQGLGQEGRDTRFAARLKCTVAHSHDAPMPLSTPAASRLLQVNHTTYLANICALLALAGYAALILYIK